MLVCDRTILIYSKVSGHAAGDGDEKGGEGRGVSNADA